MVTSTGTRTGSVKPICARSSAPMNEDASQLSARKTAEMNQPKKATTTLFPRIP
ncbi:hypothetical protein D3C73_1103100 [compost metagenome]